MKRIVAVILSIISIFGSSFAYEDFSDLKTQADNGNAVAQYDLGLFFTAQHSQADYKQALKYLRLALEQGYTPAKDLINELTTKGYKGWGDFDLLPWYDDFTPVESESETEKILVKGSNEGHAGASLLLGHNFYYLKDYATALKYYTRTLKQLNPQKSWWRAWEDPEAEGGVATEQYEDVKIMMDAITRIAYCYEHGYGVQKNITKAIAYYEMFGGYDSEFGYSETASAKEICTLIKELLQDYNNPILNEYVGECGGQIYDCFVPSPQAARAWSKISILKLKHLNSASAIEEIKNCGQIEHDPNWDTSAKLIKNLWAGEIYYKGIGVDKDYCKAFLIFNYIANEANGSWNSELLDCYPDVYADACYRLYECYAYGRGVDKNPAKASYFFNEALVYGSSSALFDDQKRYEALNQ